MLPARPRKLDLENLEARDVPAALGIADTFDAAPVYYAPAGWQQWSSNNSQYYAVSRSAASSGNQSVAIYGNVSVESRLWQTGALGGDVSLSLAVRGDTPAPILLFGRGQNLNAANASYLGVDVTTGGKVELRESSNGTIRSLKTVTPGTAATSWLRVTADFSGTQATVRVQRLDNLQFLNATGQWQATATNAISLAVTTPTGTGLVGFGRLAGSYGTAFADDFTATPIVVAPPTVPPPPATPTAPADTARNFEHIRIAQLAYAGQTVGPVEQALFASSTDLVVANPTHLNTFEAASAATPKTIYSNVTNLYENLLTDWLDYADRTGTSREAAFYHVSQATAFTGSSPSSIPVTWFWSAQKVATNGTISDLTANARGTRTPGVTFGNTGEVIAIGGLEEFREINVTLSKAAASGFNGVWEYASFTDANGTAINWKPLAIQSDGTNTLRQSGRITFNPPADWVTSRVGSGEKYYYVRFRTTAGTAANAPVASKILGRDYVNANGGTAGTIPAFDSAADANSDGYLNDAEYALRRGGFEARFTYESRLFYPYYGQMRFVVNPTFDAVKQWEGEYHADYLAANPKADGLFLDNTNGKIPFTSPVLESTANYSAASAALVAAVKQAIGNRTVIVNTSGAGANAFADGVTAAGGIAFEEFLLRPNAVNWSGLNDVAAVVNRRLAASPTAQVILDSHPGTASMLDARTRMGVLSYYYLLADPDRTYLMFFGGFAPTASWQSRWVPAAATNVGKPKGAMTTFASGLDPANALLQYKVMARQYDNALVLYKPLSYTLGKGTGTNADATATTHALNGSYRTLNADGSLGAVITSITLRNGEGAVLMKA